jgi:hypothetical protein
MKKVIFMLLSCAVFAKGSQDASAQGTPVPQASAIQSSNNAVGAVMTNDIGQACPPSQNVISQGYSTPQANTIYSGRDAAGMVMTNDVGHVNPIRSAAFALRDPYSPHPYYAYSNQGIRAGLTHQWNYQEAGYRPWHGNYNYWRWAQPTALVVPPTSAYHSSYAWGVGQVRSTPIHHQFGREGAGMIGGGQGMFSNTPYWPSSTEQFGVYPVRAPW